MYKHGAETVIGINWGSRLSVSSFPKSPPAAAASWAEHEEPFPPAYLPGNNRNTFTYRLTQTWVHIMCGIAKENKPLVNLAWQK